MDLDRLEQFSVTKRVYDEMLQTKEFLIPTRKFEELKYYLEAHDLIKDVRLLPYTIKRGFNCSKALNLAVRNAKYDNIIITSPEVKPNTDVLAQFEEAGGSNIICQVDDADVNGDLTVLVGKGYRDDTPAMYFLAKFNKSDIEKINGWDEEFMRGYAYEDNDFGARWVRAGIPFEVREDIKATHQYHPRSETIKGGITINQQRFYDNTDNNVIKCKNGLNKLQ
jgi:hypothetical protein